MSHPSTDAARAAYPGTLARGQPSEPAGLSGSVQALFDARHNVSPRRLVEPGPGPAELELLMQAAATAPDHGLLTPWHFVLIPAASRSALGDAFAHALIERDPGATTAQLEAAAEKSLRAPCLLLAVAHLGGLDTGIPETERLVSLGCAIQNILLCATALGYGSGLTSGRSLDSSSIRSLFTLAPTEQAICFIAAGSIDRPRSPRARPLAGSLLRELAP